MKLLNDACSATNQGAEVTGVAGYDRCRGFHWKGCKAKGGSSVCQPCPLCRGVVLSLRHRHNVLFHPSTVIVIMGAKVPLFLTEFSSLLQLSSPLTAV